jgi:hypothetical protein
MGDAFRGFLPRKTTPRDLYETTVIAKPLNIATVVLKEGRLTDVRTVACVRRRPLPH